MNIQKIYLYLLSFISGIYTHQYSLSGLIPLFLYICLTNFNFSIILICFIFVYFWYKLLIQASIFFAYATGTVEYKTTDHLYLTNIQTNYSSISPLKLKCNNTENIEIGDKLKFKCVHFASHNGKITKIYKIEKQSISWIVKQRLIIKNFLENSRFSPFLKSIIIGDRSGFNQEEVTKLKNGNFWHLVSISGLHMNVVVFSVFWILRRAFGLSFYLNYKFNIRLFSAIIAFLFGLLYFKISLTSIPALRALIMTSSVLFFGGMLNNKKVLLFIAGIMIFFNPAIVFNMSFQLSFLCTWILINRYNTFILNLSILPMIYQFNLVCLLTNILIFPLFSWIFVLTICSVLFKSLLILKIIDFCCVYFFKIIYLPTLSITCQFNPVAQVVYWTLFNLFVLKKHSGYLILGFMTIWIMNLFIR